MMESVFLLVWSILFLAVGLLVWKCVIAHIKVYILLVLHCIFLTGVFLLYPMVMDMGG